MIVSPNGKVFLVSSENSMTMAGVQIQSVVSLALTQRRYHICAGWSVLLHSINMIGILKRITKLWVEINFKSYNNFHFSCVA